MYVAEEGKTVGHAICGSVLKAKTKEEALKEGYRLAEDYAQVNVDRQENPSGAYHGYFRYYDSVFNTPEEANSFFDRLGSGYDGVVRIRVLSTSEANKFEERRQKIYRKIRDLHSQATETFRARTSEVISCKSCGNRFPKITWLQHSVLCPYCRNWNVPNGTKEREAKLKNDLVILQREYEQACAKSDKLVYYARYSCRT